MAIPSQLPPINRKEIFVPHSVLNLTGHLSKEKLIDIQMDLLHGANFNDPQPFRVMSYANAKLTL